MKSLTVKLPADVVTYKLEALPEDMHPRDSFGDEEDAQWALDQLKRGNEWGWCVAKVTASIEVDGVTFEGHDYLGGCAYKSEADFRGPSGPFGDMKVEALADLRRTLMDAAKRGDVAIRALEMVAP